MCNNKWENYKNRCDSMCCRLTANVPWHIENTSNVHTQFTCYYIVSLNEWKGRACERAPASMQLTDRNKRNKMNLRARLLVTEIA